jgi:hypothetical protein
MGFIIVNDTIRDPRMGNVLPGTSFFVDGAKEQDFRHLDFMRVMDIRVSISNGNLYSPGTQRDPDGYCMV